MPKNFAQDTVVCAEILGIEADMHKYAVQITVADVRGSASSSTLQGGGQLGQGQHHLRTDGLRWGDHGGAADRVGRLSPRDLEEPRETPLGQALRLSPGTIVELTWTPPSVIARRGFHLRPCPTIAEAIVRTGRKTPP